EREQVQDRDEEPAGRNCQIDELQGPHSHRELLSGRQQAHLGMSGGGPLVAEIGEVRSQIIDVERGWQENVVGGAAFAVGVEVDGTPVGPVTLHADGPAVHVEPQHAGHQRRLGLGRSWARDTPEGMPWGNRANALSSAHLSGGTRRCGVYDCALPAAVPTMIHTGAVRMSTKPFEIVDSTPSAVIPATLPTSASLIVSLPSLMDATGNTTGATAPSLPTPRTP